MKQENKTPEQIQSEAAVLPTQYDSAYMGAMPGDPNVFTASNEMNKLNADVMLDTDISTRAYDLRQQKLQPYKDLAREEAMIKQEAIDEQLLEAEKNRPILDDVITASFEVDNAFGAALLSVDVPIMDPVKGYQPLRDEDLEGYYPIIKEIAKYRNPAQVAIVKESYDREKMLKNLIATASTGDAILGSMIAGLADPMNLILFAGAATTVGRAANAVRVAGISASVTAIQEVTLYQGQHSRTLDEGAINVVAGLLLDSVIGGTGSMSRLVKELPTQTTAMKREVEAYLRSGGGTPQSGDGFDTSVGAAMVPVEDLQIKKWDKTKTPIRWALGNTAYFMSRIATPIGKAISASSNKARTAAVNLAETNIELTGDFGQIAAETLIKVDMRRASAVRIEVMNIEKQAKKEFGMSAQAFRDELDSAQRAGDSSSNPLVDKAAKKLRNVTQDLWDRAAQQRIKGTYIEKPDGTIEPIKTGTALSYQTRVYDLKKVDADYDGFIRAIQEGAEDSRITNNSKINSKINRYRADTAKDMANEKTAIDEAQKFKVAKRKLIANHERAIRGNDKTIGRLKSKDIDDPRIDSLEQRNKGIIKKKKQLEAEIKVQDKAITNSKSKISANKKHIKDLEDGIIPEYTETDLNAYSQSFYESVVGLKDGDMHFAAGAKPSILKRRTNIKDSFLQDFLEKDWAKRLDQTTKTLSPRIRLAEKFGEGTGDIEMSRVIDDIGEDYNGMIMERREAGDIKAANKLAREKGKQIKNITLMRDRLLGRMHGEDRNSPMQIIGRSLLNFNTSRMLNGMLISSLPEVSKMMARYGMKNFNRALMKASKNIKIKSLPQDEAMRIASAVYRAQGTRTTQMNDLYDLTPTSAVEEGTRKLAQMTAYFSGQQGFDSLFKSVAGALSQDGMARAIRRGDKAMLRKNGFTDDEIKIMSRESNTHSLENGGLWELNNDMWNYTPDDLSLGFRPKALKDKIDAAIVKDADTIIVQPGVGDLPAFYNSMTGRMVFQFKSFIMGATNRTLLPMLQGTNVEMFKNMAYMNGLGLLGHIAYEAGVGREVKWDNPEKLINEMMNRGGYMGYASELLELSRRLAGKESAGKWKGRNDVGAFLGPTFGTAKDIWRAASVQRDKETGELLTDVDARLHAVRKLSPFQNHWALRQGIDELEGKAAQAMGGTGRFADKDRGGSVSQ